MANISLSLGSRKRRAFQAILGAARPVPFTFNVQIMLKVQILIQHALSKARDTAAAAGGARPTEDVPFLALMAFP